MAWKWVLEKNEMGLKKKLPCSSKDQTWAEEIDKNSFALKVIHTRSILGEITFETIIKAKMGFSTCFGFSYPNVRY